MAKQVLGCFRPNVCSVWQMPSQGQVTIVRIPLAHNLPLRTAKLNGSASLTVSNCSGSQGCEAMTFHGDARYLNQGLTGLVKHAMMPCFRESHLLKLLWEGIQFELTGRDQPEIGWSQGVTKLTMVSWTHRLGVPLLVHRNFNLSMNHPVIHQ